MKRARAPERGPYATPAHYEINGRDLKSGKLDAARAREEGAARPMAARRGPGAWGASQAARYYLFYKNVIFFLSYSADRSTDSGSEMNARVNCTLMLVLTGAAAAPPDDRVLTADVMNESKT